MDTIHGSILAFHCNWCPKKFPHKITLENHITSSHLSLDGPQFACEICNRQFYSMGNVRAHLKVTHNIAWEQKPPTCKFCAKIFKSESKLEVHLRYHKGEKPFQCQICGKSYASASSMNSHLKKHEGNPAKVVCKVCGKGFSFTTALNTHMQSHKKVPDERCHICGWATKYKRQLKAHIAGHDGLRPVFKCSDCGLAFLTSEQRAKHLEKNHNKPRASFTCQFCGKVILKKIPFNLHLKLHQGILDHECDLCEAAFSCNKYLQRHRVEKHKFIPYKCEKCKLGFMKQGLLKDHNQSVHFNFKQK